MLRYRLTLFRLLGFPIQIDATWIFIAVLILWSLSTGLFPMVLPDQDPAIYWRMGGVALLGFAASIVLHELGHAVVARSYDMPIRSITLFIFGGVAEMEKEPPSAKAEFWVAIAGPIMSVVVAVAFGALAYLFGGPPALPEIGDGQIQTAMPEAVVFSYLAFLNVILAVFNMVPAFPLDGGRVLRAILWGVRGNLMWATRVAAGFGSGFAALLVAWAIFNLTAGNPVGAVWYFILGLFVHSAAQGQVYYQKIRSALEPRPVKSFMRTELVVVDPDMTVERLISEYFYTHYYKSFPVVHRGELLGVVYASDVRKTDSPERLRVRDVMRPADEDLVIQPDTDSATALQRMQINDQTRLMVCERGKLIGVIALRDLMNFLSIRQDLESG